MMWAYRRNLALLVAFVLMCGIFTDRVLAGQTPAEWLKEPKANPIFVLAPDTLAKSFIDVSGNGQVETVGGVIVSDNEFGSCLRLGAGENNVVRVKVPAGSGLFKGGVTFETWIHLEKPLEKNPKKPVGLIMKPGAISWHFKEGKLANGWMNFPTEPVATDHPDQIKTYPMGSGEINGVMALPLEQWVHLAITYNPKTKTYRSWVNGGIDREYVFNREGDLQIEDGKGDEFLLMRGVQNCRIAGVRLMKGARDPNVVDPMKVFVNQLPWQNRFVVSIDQISEDIKLPLDVTVMIEAPSGPNTVVAQKQLTSHATSHIEITDLKMRDSMSTCLVKVNSERKEVYRSATRLSMPRAHGPVAINADKSLSIDGKKIFPRFIYHVFAEDYEQVKKIGFNIISPRDPEMRGYQLRFREDKDVVIGAKVMESAGKQNIYLTPPAGMNYNNLRHLPALANNPNVVAWYGFDEPWGRLDKVLESYNAVKLLDPAHPIIICQNNLNRAHETSLGCDILCPDPYPIPNVSLRLVADATRAAITGVYGRKPVWTILPAYQAKLPNKAEMRCMIYIALCAGANGIGVYAWDDRLPPPGESLDPKARTYLPSHPESLKAVADSIAELSALENILVVPNSENEAGFEPQRSCLHSAIKVANGKRYLFLANDSRQAERGTLVLKDIKSATAKPLPECGFTESFTFKDGRADVTLPKLAAAVFEITEK